MSFAIGSQSTSATTTATGVAETSALRLNQPAATPGVASSFAGDTHYLGSSDSDPFTVLKEDARVSDITPTAITIDGTDGDRDTVPFTLTIDEANDGFLSSTLGSGIGLANAKPISLSAVPVGSGSSYSCPSPGANDTTYVSGDPDTARATCSMANMSVNVYELTATIGGNHFTGGGLSALSVYDPALGFTTGGGWFKAADGAKVNFGFNAKYLKSGQIQGSVLTIFNRSNGNYVVKSNSMGALAVKQVSGQSYYSATLNGKATYAVPTTDPLLGCGARKCGEYTFTVYVEDRKEPGAGYDQFWIEVKDPNGNVVLKASMPRSSGGGAAPLTILGGNVQVPH